VNDFQPQIILTGDFRKQAAPAVGGATIVKGKQLVHGESLPVCSDVTLPPGMAIQTAAPRKHAIVVM
jgi:hypothetical protein